MVLFPPPGGGGELRHNLFLSTFHLKPLTGAERDFNVLYHLAMVTFPFLISGGLVLGTHFVQSCFHW